jgi:hypothetical protein
MDPIEPGSIYATVQSASMGGRGTVAVNNAVRAGALTSSAAIVYRAYRVWKRRDIVP